MSEIDLSLLPPPDVVESLDYEAILAAITADYVRRHPQHTAWVESDPALKLLEAAAYRELLLRARINDAARAVLLASAGGNDLIQIAALFGVRAAVGEGDGRLRRRVQLSLEALSTAGPAKSYIAHALNADASIKDATATSPTPGAVHVTVLGGGAEGDGAAPAALVDRASAALNDQTVRPLTDVVTVRGATIVPYLITASLTVASGPDAAVVRARARAAVEAYARSVHALGATVAVSGIHAALHVDGVLSVDLSAPAADIATTAAQAPWPTDGAAANYSAPDSHPFGGIAVTVA